MATLDDYLSMSDYYQPFTSYAWTKKTKTPNPLLSKWQDRLKAAKEQAASKGLPAEKNRELKALVSQLEIEVKEMKARSSLIAEKDPFIVISLLFRPYAATNKHTPQIGDYAVVIYGDKMYPAICGDYGPTSKMGEASLFMAKAINPKATPYRRPESDLKVTYLIFPGTAEKPNAAPSLDHWHQKCSSYLKEVGAPGAGHELHHWIDPFKKPEPPPVAALQAAPKIEPPKPADAPPATPGAPTLPAVPASTAPPPTAPATAPPGAPATAPASLPAPAATPAPGLQ
jgi:hypothetical protein